MHLHGRGTSAACLSPHPPPATLCPPTRLALVLPVPLPRHPSLLLAWAPSSCIISFSPPRAWCPVCPGSLFHRALVRHCYINTVPHHALAHFKSIKPHEPLCTFSAAAPSPGLRACRMDGWTDPRRHDPLRCRGQRRHQRRAQRKRQHGYVRYMHVPGAGAGGRGGGAGGGGGASCSQVQQSCSAAWAGGSARVRGRPAVFPACSASPAGVAWRWHPPHPHRPLPAATTPWCCAAVPPCRPAPLPPPPRPHHKHTTPAHTPLLPCRCAGHLWRAHHRRPGAGAAGHRPQGFVPPPYM